MWSHSLSVSITKPKSSYQFYLCLKLFVFLFLLFKVQALDHHHGITIIMIFTVASPLGIMLPISWSLRWTRLALRVSSIHPNQTRAFNLPLFGNWWQPFYKDMNLNHFESMLLAQPFLPRVKDLDKFHEPPLVAFAPSTYVLRVWIESLHICIDKSCGRVMSTKWC